MGALEPGTVFDEKYLIEAKIGQGAIGVVYRASDLNLSRTVALKILTLPMASINHSRLMREGSC